ncbi:MAG: hypothetical protein QGG36_22555 [Pirellulaceae bacterium]|jgi:hypothetical protein|nr:hypothetical protein [Pirellulaceae bacterium]
MNEPTRTLADLFQIDALEGELWRDDELASVFSHQMKTPLAIDLSSQRDAATASGDALTFGGLLQQQQPSLEMLTDVKQFAKTCGSTSDGRLPRQVAAALYISAIAVAWLRCGEKISDQSAAALREKMTWAAGQDWIGDDVRALLQAAAERM